MPVEERRERLSRARRRLDEDVPAARDRRPAQRLRGASARQTHARTSPSSAGEKTSSGSTIVSVPLRVVSSGTCASTSSWSAGERPVASSQRASARASDRHVCLLEAGPDYGPLADGRWPPECSTRVAPVLARLGTGRRGRAAPRRADPRRLVGRATPAWSLAGSPADYDEWGHELVVRDLGRTSSAPGGLRAAPANTDRPGAVPRARSSRPAQAAGLPLLADLERPGEPGGRRAPFAAQRRRRHALERRPRLPRRRHEDARNLTVARRHARRPRSPRRTSPRASSTADGRRLEAGMVVLAAGAYFIAGDPPPQRHRAGGRAPSSHGIRCVQTSRSESACSTTAATDVAWELTDSGPEADGCREPRQPASSSRTPSSRPRAPAAPPGSWDLHLLPWISAGADDGALRGERRSSST